MQEFRDYVISKFKVHEAKALKFCFSHSATLKKGKANGAQQIIDIITVKIKFIDENLNILLSPNLTLESNTIPKSNEKTLINISPKEHSNKFAKAKPEFYEFLFKFFAQRDITKWNRRQLQQTEEKDDIVEASLSSYEMFISSCKS